MIAVLVAILTLSVSGAVAVLAQENEEPEEEAMVEELIPRIKLFMSRIESGELLSRVADKLGISEEELSDALEEAKEDIAAERGEQAFEDLLEQAVEEGLITEEEAAEVADWWAQKPEAFNRTMLRNAFSGMCQNPGALTDEGCMQFKEMRRNIWQWRQKVGAAEGSADETGAWRGNNAVRLNQASSQPQIMQAARGRQMVAFSK